MNIDELDLEYRKLFARVRGVNQWIENNILTDPNFYEMVDLRMEFCKLAYNYNAYYARDGYPMIEENGKARRANEYDVFKAFPQLYELEEELQKMYDMRKDSPFFQEELPNKLISELSYNAKVPSFDVPDLGENARAIAQAAGVYFYIWQQSQYNADFKYDNSFEFDDIQRKIDEMKENGDYYMDDIVDALMDGIKQKASFYDGEYTEGMVM